jgi:hypothetical protein
MEKLVAYMIKIKKSPEIIKNQRLRQAIEELNQKTDKHLTALDAEISDLYK